jgi:DNA-binding NtrC family response regulator
LRALAETRNKVLLARQLGISRTRLYRLLEKYGLDEEPAAGGSSEQKQ